MSWLDNLTVSDRVVRENPRCADSTCVVARSREGYVFLYFDDLRGMKPSDVRKFKITTEVVDDE